MPTREERIAELRKLLEEPLEVTFDEAHKRIEELLERSVWTHELAFPDVLYYEIETGHAPTFADVLGKIPKGKGIVVLGGGPGLDAPVRPEDK